MSNTATPPASWPAYAAKFLLSLGIAVVGAAATITAAVADDHVSAQETWSIALAIILGLGGAYGVYKVPNNYAGRRDGRHELGGSPGGGPTDTIAGGVGVPTTAVRPGAGTAYPRGTGYPPSLVEGEGEDLPDRPGLG